MGENWHSVASGREKQPRSPEARTTEMLNNFPLSTLSCLCAYVLAVRIKQAQSDWSTDQRKSGTREGRHRVGWQTLEGSVCQGEELILLFLMPWEGLKQGMAWLLKHFKRLPCFQKTLLIVVWRTGFRRIKRRARKPPRHGYDLPEVVALERDRSWTVFWRQNSQYKQMGSKCKVRQGEESKLMPRFVYLSI